LRVWYCAIALAACNPQPKSPWEGGGTAVGNPARTSVRPAVAVGQASAASSAFQVLRCDGTRAESVPMDVDLSVGEGPLLPGGELCSISWTHEGFGGDLRAEPGSVILGGYPLVVDGGDVVLELGEIGSDMLETTSGLFNEIVVDGLVDPIERSRGPVVFGVDRMEIEPAPAKLLIQVGTDGRRIVRSDPAFPQYSSMDQMPVNYEAIAYGDGVWMAVGGDGASGVVSISEDDGMTWTSTKRESPLNGVAFGAGRFVVSNDAQGLESYVDGTWETLDAPLLGYEGMAWSGIGFLAVAGSHIAFSPHGQSWTGVEPPDLVGVGALAAGGNDERLVIVGDFGYRASSTDGLTWTEVSTGGEPLLGVAWNGSEFLAVGDQDTWRSPDANAWTAGPTKNLEDVTSYLGVFYGLDGSGALFEIGDDETWQEYIAAPELGTFVALASSQL